jgi:antitoxin component of RelBE/YafQ-DinJ toxin-antitoxin module
MAAAIRMNLDTREVQRALEQLGVKARPAMVRAINRTAASAKTAMVRVVAKDMKLKATDVRERIGVRHATPGRLAAQLTASAKRLPLKDFGARPTRRGVSANTGGGRKVYPGTFIAQMGTGHVGVFGRTSTKRLPIAEHFGPSVVQVFEKHQQVGIDRATEQLEKNVASELRFALSKTT